MKLLLNVKNSKADFLLELLANLRFIKTRVISNNEAKFIKDLYAAMHEVTKAKEGKLKLKSARKLLSELD